MAKLAWRIQEGSTHMSNTLVGIVGRLDSHKMLEQLDLSLYVSVYIDIEIDTYL